MGLDHGFTRKSKSWRICDKCGHRLSGVEEDQEIATFRKHPNLHGWIEKRWRDVLEPPETEDFNCVDFYLDLDTVLQLKRDNLADRLPPTSGFFFGTDADDIYRDALDEACDEMIRAIADGDQVYYWSWW